MRREKCAACGNCARECPTGALELRGETCTLEELLDLVCRDRPFYEQSGGGVTFSGGEPLMQFDFVKQCLQRSLHLWWIYSCGISNTRMRKNTAR